VKETAAAPITEASSLKEDGPLTGDAPFGEAGQSKMKEKAESGAAVSGTITCFLVTKHLYTTITDITKRGVIMKFSRAQGLSMTTIVVAALALLVLVVLTLIFTGRMGGWTTTVEANTDCQTYCDSLGFKAPYTVGECSGDDSREVKAGDQTCCCHKIVQTS
jgi:hypothetical protein